MLIRLKKYYILPGHGQIDFGGKVLTRTRHAALCISNSVTVLSMHCFLQWRGKHTLRPMKTKEERGEMQESRDKMTETCGCTPSPTGPALRHRDGGNIRLITVQAAVEPLSPSSFRNQCVSFLTDANKWLNKPAVERRRSQAQFVKIGTQEIDKRTTTSCSIRRKL